MGLGVSLGNGVGVVLDVGGVVGVWAALGAEVGPHPIMTIVNMPSNVINFSK